MKTGIFGAICLLVLTFTIAECGLPQKKRQTSSCDDVLQTCMTTCQQAADAGGSDTVLTECRENCNTAHDVCTGNVPDGGNDDASCDDILQTCMTTCQQAADAGGSEAVLTQCRENCNTAHDVCSDANGGNVPDDDDDNNDEDSGATAIAGATIFSTISALLVAVASAMN